MSYLLSTVRTLGMYAVGADTQALIVSSVSQNTLRSYRFWSREIEMWLGGGTIKSEGFNLHRSLDDGLLAERGAQGSRKERG